MKTSTRIIINTDDPTAQRQRDAPAQKLLRPGSLAALTLLENRQPIPLETPPTSPLPSAPTLEDTLTDKQKKLNEALKCAVVKNNSVEVATLLDQGADPNILSGLRGSVPLLTIAASALNASMVESLIYAGADVNRTVSNCSDSDYTYTALKCLQNYWSTFPYNPSTAVNFEKIENLLLREAKYVNKKKELVACIETQITRTDILELDKKELIKLQSQLRQEKSHNNSKLPEIINQVEREIEREAKYTKEKKELISYIETQIARTDLLQSKKDNLIKLQAQLQEEKSHNNSKLPEIIKEARRYMSDHAVKGVKGFFTLTFLRDTKGQKAFNKIFDATGTLKEKPKGLRK